LVPANEHAYFGIFGFKNLVTQIAGGKRYDLAVLGRRTANATFSNAHATDHESAMQWAMDLTPLVQDDSLDPIAYTVGFIDRLKSDVTARLRKSL
jgi:hypothetical protein